MTPLYAAPPLAVARVYDPVGLRRGRALLLDHVEERRGALGVDPRRDDRLLRAAIDDPVATFVHGRSSLLVATDAGRDVGIAVVHPLTNRCAELRYVHTRPWARGAGVGRALVSAALVHCRAAGFHSVCVDVLAEHTAAARALGESFGFTTSPGGASACTSVLVGSSASAASETGRD